MNKSIHIFKSFEEQQKFFLEYFFKLGPSERLQSLAKLQKMQNKDFGQKSIKKITIKKHFAHGY